MGGCFLSLREVIWKERSSQTRKEESKKQKKKERLKQRKKEERKIDAKRKGKKEDESLKGKKRGRRSKGHKQEKQEQATKRNFEERGVGRTEDPNPVKVQEIGLFVYNKRSQKQKTTSKKNKTNKGRFRVRWGPKQDTKNKPKEGMG